MAIFDSHAHYDSERFDGIRDDVISSMPSNNVSGIVNCGSDIASSKTSISLAEKYPFIYAAVGVHPHEAEASPEDYLDILRDLSGHDKVVAIGEIGLDYHYDLSPRDLQKRFLSEQLALAAELDLPVILHDRESHEDMYSILSRFAPLKGVMHCFSGSVELMRQALSYGLYIGIGGSLTFKNARVPVEVAAAVPMDRFLLETDAPYMAPVPHRGETNVSPFIIHVAEKMAEIRNVSVDEILLRGEENAKTLFGI